MTHILMNKLNVLSKKLESITQTQKTPYAIMYFKDIDNSYFIYEKQQKRGFKNKPQLLEYIKEFKNKNKDAYDFKSIIQVDIVDNSKLEQVMINEDKKGVM